MMVRVESPTFVAGLIIGEDGVCSLAAPILASRKTVGAVGKSADWLRAEFKRRGWKATVILPHKEKGPEGP